MSSFGVRGVGFLLKRPRSPSPALYVREVVTGIVDNIDPPSVSSASSAAASSRFAPPLPCDAVGHESEHKEPEAVFFELLVDVIGIATFLAAGVLVYLVFRVN